MEGQLRAAIGSRTCEPQGAAVIMLKTLGEGYGEQLKFALSPLSRATWRVFSYSSRVMYRKSMSGKQRDR